uniref:Uncharacterized protein n=1 Tax=Panagrolaimus sp. ES5 TaxID=591445 RepID=A0AC34FEF3_9BILA
MSLRFLVMKIYVTTENDTYNLLYDIILTGLKYRNVFSSNDFLDASMHHIPPSNHMPTVLLHSSNLTSDDIIDSLIEKNQEYFNESDLLPFYLLLWSDEED